VRSWRGPLAALVAVRVAIPLAALSASGSDLPGIPRYDYAPLNGDANDYYAAGRELISTLLGRLGVVAIPVAFALSATLETLTLTAVLLTRLRSRLETR